MARNVCDREDLLRDGVQMPIHGRTLLEGLELFVGFRSAGQFALYCNQDPVFQFNADHQLRRAFFKGHRYAAYSGQLHLLRQSDTGLVQVNASRLKLEPVPANAEELVLLLNGFSRVRNLLLNHGPRWEFVGVDSAVDFDSRVNGCLKKIGDPLAVAETPNA